jgi:hypothetical protein
VPWVAARVEPPAAADHIVAGTAVDHIVTQAAVDGIAACAATEGVVAPVTEHGVIAGSARIAIAPAHGSCVADVEVVFAGAAEADVIARPSV